MGRGMDRRRFVLVALAAIGVPDIAGAQQSRKIPKIGVMMVLPIPNALMKSFGERLRELGYVEGQNIQVEYRSADGRPERFPALAAEFVRLNVDVIVSGGGAPAVRAARQATSTIPIVFPALADPIAIGAVNSLARPGGNVTGISMRDSEMSAKRLQLLREILPKLKRVAVLRDPKGAAEADALQNAARSLGIELQLFVASIPEQFDAAFDAARKANAEALIVLPSGTFAAHHQLLVDLAMRNRMASVWEQRQFTDAGGLLSYGPDFQDNWRIAARYVDRILKGAKPAEMPVEQATKFELTINLKTAKVLGITIPNSLLVRADQVIQ